jgi:hypothetical protein
MIVCCTAIIHSLLNKKAQRELESVTIEETLPGLPRGSFFPGQRRIFNCLFSHHY